MGVDQVINDGVATFMDVVLMIEDDEMMDAAQDLTIPPDENVEAEEEEVEEEEAVPVYQLDEDSPTWIDQDGWRRFFDDAARESWVLAHGQPCILEVVFWPPLNPKAATDRGSWAIQCHRLAKWVDFCTNPEEEPWLPHCSLRRPCDMDDADVEALQHTIATLDGRVHNLRIWHVNERCAMFTHRWDSLWQHCWAEIRRLRRGQHPGPVSMSA